MCQNISTSDCDYYIHDQKEPNNKYIVLAEVMSILFLLRKSKVIQLSVHKNLYGSINNCLNDNLHYRFEHPENGNRKLKRL